jgi:5-aminolevulinate synthase
MSIYKNILRAHLNKILLEDRYRTFVNLERDANKFPYAFCKSINSDVVLWCSNDYLGMGLHPDIIKSAQIALNKFGIGAGGTRNISGNSSALVELEETLAYLHQKEQALVFSSGYVANQSTLVALATVFKDLVFFSDSDNHSSIISGIRNSRAEKYIFDHNSVGSLRSQLQKVAIDRPKIIVFESIYSMDGSISPIKEICALAKEYNALTYIDEVHAVALYGAHGGGVSEKLGLNDHIDIIQGTLGKGFGGFGGYIAAEKDIIESIRLTAAGLIFTTALPPVIAAGLNASIKHLMNSSIERDMHQMKVAMFKQKLLKANINFLNNDSHIIPIIIGDAKLAKSISERLLKEYKIYVQHINYPTVPKGTERLRVIITPHHSEQMMKDFIAALIDVGLANTTRLVKEDLRCHQLVTDSLDLAL